MNNVKFSKRVIGGRKQRGVAMTEYIIILALVAIAAIAVFSTFGHTVKAQVAQITNGLAGQTAGVTTNANLAKTQAGTSTTLANKTVGLDVYGQDVKAQ